MKHELNRRGFLRASGTLAAGIGLASVSGSRLLAANLAGGTPNADRLGWRLACQMYTFNRFKSFSDSVEKAASLRLKWIEGYPGQPLSKEKAETRTNASLSAADRAEVKKQLADAGIKLVSYASVKLSGDEAECREDFEFAKDMGVEILVGDPFRRTFPMLDKLAEEYGIDVAIHNHDHPWPNWNVDRLLEACGELSERIGVCGDTGYWLRVGADPVEMAGKLGPRLKSLYLKDVNAPGRKGVHDVPYGTGVGNVKGVLEAIHRQGIKPLFVIEYTHNWTESLPEVAQCVEFFDTVAGELAGA
ncbi:MAG: sugar phosphate isomerase/epimerase family protein [Planctomycetota bacterium]|jgi:sugar phosphate isomerase/epimerase